MRILLIASVVLVAACGGDWAVWTILTGRLGTSFAQWADTARAQGWKVTSDAPLHAGFPFAAVLILPGLRIGGGDGAIPGGMDWHADQVDLNLSLWHPGRLMIEPHGHQSLRISRSPNIAFTADRIAAWVPLGRLEPGDTAHVQVVADSVFGGIVGAHHPRDVQVAKLDLHLDVSRDRSGRTGATLRLNARAIALPDTGRWPLGALVGSVAADVALSSPPLTQADPDHAADGDAAAAAGAWRNGGGHVAVNSFDLKWGPLTLGLVADLRLDDKLQPAGQGTARAMGTDEALDALSRGGTIPPGVADTAKAILGLMGRTPASGEPGVEMPFTLKNSTLSLGKIPLTRLREVDWGRV